MKRSIIKSAGLLALGVSLTLASCGGGGGDPGTPLFPTTAKLIMSPNIEGISLPLGYSAEPVKISGGQPPYFTGATGGVRPTLLDDGTLHVQALAVNNTSTDGTGCESDDYIWVQDSSYNQTQIKFNVCVSAVPAVPLQSTLGATASLTLSPGGSQTFTVYGGSAPYTAASDNPSAVSITPGSSMTGTFTVTAGNNASASGTAANITVTDAKGAVLTVTVNNVIAKALAASPASLSDKVGSSLTVSLVGGVAPYKVTSSNTGVATAVLNGSSVAVNLVAAGTSTLTIQDASGANIAVAVTASAVPTGLTVIPPIQDLLETASVKAASFTLIGATGPFYVSVPTYVAGTSMLTGNLVAVTPMSTTTATTITVTRVATCLKSNYTIPLTVTDTSSGKSATITTQLINSDTSNDNDAGCL